MQEITLSSALNWSVERIGNEKTPIVIVDDVLDDVDALVKLALDQTTFKADEVSAYPGIKSELPTEFYDAIKTVCSPLLYRQYAVPATLTEKVIERFFSVVTRQPEDLALLQRVPHYDSHERFFFAMLYYMTDGPFGGTGFFRHRPTGFERISVARRGEYIAAAQSYMQENGLPESSYMQGSDDHYELIGKVDHRPNRLVIYPGNLLHSGLIDPTRDIQSNPANGRLTANVFIEFC
ncbi:DUF6445 family protein [Marinimicrobium sp. ABcell2]|uniref:DUF6445 family protein n=1 Tax=Marinimicrobium sp. ABcell2 TaxID=3069751 RepID=UPI0027B078A7|nr:DUF6445 family protein [Marinimicrobium sp. ABcell2]MDQ2075882.1 DUF6445 family protein [Marinimicrobium sp. ABcell2]